MILFLVVHVVSGVQHTSARRSRERQHTLLQEKLLKLLDEHFDDIRHKKTATMHRLSSESPLPMVRLGLTWSIVRLEKEYIFVKRPEIHKTEQSLENEEMTEIIALVHELTPA